MKRLLMIAHGSRNESSNEEVRLLSTRVAASLALGVDEVSVAFLELASPTIGEALDDCFNRGAEEVVVLPYFLAAGAHVVRDIPDAIDAVARRWPDNVISVLPHLGASEAMASLIVQAYNR
ncbi:MAG: sirohydrochlorin ferrochelatase [Motiliproteus sp.]|jgi:sirohydrochlorin ferrochelatase